MLPRDPRRGSFFDLSDRTKLRLSGPDRVRFVNGQITNDVSKATEISAIAACVLNAKGKLNGHIFASVQADSIVIDADAKLRDSLALRIERYIIADDVQVEDITEKFAIFHCLGLDSNPVPGCRWMSADRYGISGFDVWVEMIQTADVKAKLAAVVPLCDDSCAEQFRIEQGIPRWGFELTEDTIPIDANLEQSCVDYSKGCYIGQEVISRMKMSGQRNKGLYGFIAQEDRDLVAGMKLWSPNDRTKEVGWLTSATRSDRLGKPIALGYVKRPFNQPGAQLRATAGDSAPITVEIVGLPFPDPSL